MAQACALKDEGEEVVLAQSALRCSWRQDGADRHQLQYEQQGEAGGGGERRVPCRF